MRASEVLRVTQGGGTPTLLGKALAEYGRIAKTEHLLDFINLCGYPHRSTYAEPVTMPRCWERGYQKRPCRWGPDKNRLFPYRHSFRGRTLVMEATVLP
ncbi:hypothetical protein [Arthrobacter sp. A5]|uniref:hypothetical protein n=1 Tax=Arthrobacter sp. A5 TaxID=576926 RepID=UPI003DA9FB3C